MKALKYIFSTFAALLALASCGEDVDYTPAPKDKGAGVYFSLDNSSLAFRLKEGQTSVAVPVYRNNAGGEFTTNIANTYTGGIFSIPTAASFADGEKQTEIVITFDFAKLEEGEVYRFDLGIDDDDNLSGYGGQQCSVAISYTPVELGNWEPAGYAIFSQDVFTIPEGEVAVEHEVGTNNYRIAKFLYQLYPLSEFAECENIVFTLDDKYEPVSVRYGVINTNYEEEGESFQFFYQNTVEENPDLDYLVDYCSFTRRNYVYTINCIFCINMSPYAPCKLQFEWFDNPLDSQWTTRFTPDYNKGVDYVQLNGIGKFTTQTDSPATTYDCPLWISNDGQGIYYMPNLYADDYGLAFNIEILGDASSIEILDNQPLGFKVFGRDVYASMSQNIGSSYEQTADGMIIKLGLQFHDAMGNSFGDFEETFAFKFNEPTPEAFHGEYGIVGWEQQYDETGELLEPEQIYWLGVTISETSKPGYDVVVKGLFSSLYPTIFPDYDDSVYGTYDIYTNQVLLSATRFTKPISLGGTALYDLYFRPLDWEHKLYESITALTLDDNGHIWFDRSFRHDIDVKPDGFALYVQNQTNTNDAGSLISLYQCVFMPKEVFEQQESAPQISSVKSIQKSIASRPSNIAFSNLRKHESGVISGGLLKKDMKKRFDMKGL